MNPKITLIVTVYNRLEYARNIILCLLNQKEQVHELIFADDGSSENLMDYIGELIPKCNFKVKHVSQEDKGFRLAKSRNNAAKIANGDYLIFLDQDVIFSSEFIKKIKSNVKPNIFLVSKAYMTNKEEKEKIQKKIDSGNCKYREILGVLKRDEEFKIIRKLHNKDIIRSFLHKYKFKKRGAKLVGLFSCIPKEAFFKINGFDEKYIGWGKEDDDLGNRLFKSGLKSKPIYFSELMIHLYHPSDSSKKASMNERYYRKRKKEIMKGNYRCKYGIDNTLEKDQIIIRNLK